MLGGIAIGIATLVLTLFGCLVVYDIGSKNQDNSVDPVDPVDPVPLEPIFNPPEILCNDNEFLKGKTCKKCPIGCSQCENIDFCKHCEDDYVMYQKNCVQQCALNLVNIGGECQNVSAVFIKYDDYYLTVGQQTEFRLNDGQQNFFEKATFILHQSSQNVYSFESLYYPGYFLQIMASTSLTLNEYGHKFTIENNGAFVEILRGRLYLKFKNNTQFSLEQSNQKSSIVNISRNDQFQIIHDDFLMTRRSLKHEQDLMACESTYFFFVNGSSPESVKFVYSSDSILEFTDQESGGKEDQFYIRQYSKDNFIFESANYREKYISLENIFASQFLYLQPNLFEFKIKTVKQRQFAKSCVNIQHKQKCQIISTTDYFLNQCSNTIATVSVAEDGRILLYYGTPDEKAFSAYITLTETDDSYLMQIDQEYLTAPEHQIQEYNLTDSITENSYWVFFCEECG